MSTLLDIQPPRPAARAPMGPAEAARKLIGRDYLSWSSVSTYQKCPLKFYFQYVEGSEPEFVASSLLFGSAMHTALEHHFRCLFEGVAAPGLDELLRFYDEAWAVEQTRPIRFGKSESEGSLRDLAKRMLSAFQASEAAGLESEVLALERSFRAPIVSGCPDLLGRIDLIILPTDQLRIVDFKTSRSNWNEAKVREAAPQQLLYCELVKPLADEFGDRALKIEWGVLTKTKQPAVQRHVLTPDGKQLQRAKTMVRRVWQSITAGHFYPVPSTMNCTSSPFQTACAAWEG